MVLIEEIYPTLVKGHAHCLRYVPNVRHAHSYLELVIVINPQHSEQFCILSQWFLNLLSNQALSGLVAQAWFDRRFKNHYF